MIITDKKILRAPNALATIEEGKDIIKQLEIALKDSPIPGVGLAAPQIGINKKVCIVRTEKVNFDLINPEIISTNGRYIYRKEGCLSLPDILIDTQRFEEIHIKDELHPAGIVATGFVAVIVQHEIDHLENILITDRGAGRHKIKRNDPCPCGKKSNGKFVKFKKCHGKSGG